MTMRSSAALVRSLLGVILLIDMTGCAALVQQRVLYDRGGVQIGLAPDRSILQDSATSNSHPVSFTSEQMRHLLSALQVSGYSGTLVGLVVEPPPRPIFSQEELELIVTPIADAFRQAGPRDRIFFSIPDLHARYHRERTEGECFVRAPYLFVLLKDHSAFPRTDTGGGDDEQDPRDYKGMQLSVVPPVRAVTPAKDHAPRWGPYEQVHLAIDVQQAEAAWAAANHAHEAGMSHPPTAQVRQSTPGSESSLPSAPVDSVDTLRLQVRELTQANQDLRKKLSEQTAEMDDLKEALIRIQQDLDRTKAKTAPRRKSAP